MSETKKRMGRPKKSPLEKGEQFSIRLPLVPKLILEGIARHRNISLSEAAEYLIIHGSETYKVDGEPIGDLISKRLRKMGSSLILAANTAGDHGYPTQIDVSTLGVSSIPNKKTKLYIKPQNGVGEVLSSPFFRTFVLLPPSVWDDSDRFFHKAFSQMTTEGDLSLKAADDCYGLGRAMFITGFDIERAASELDKLAKAYQAKE